MCDDKIANISAANMVMLYYKAMDKSLLTHWGHVTHICVSKLNTTASDNGLSPGRRQSVF